MAFQNCAISVLDEIRGVLPLNLLHGKSKQSSWRVVDIKNRYSEYRKTVT
jgi:hypothetical protein